MGAIGATCALASVLGTSVSQLYNAHQNMKRIGYGSDYNWYLVNARSLQERLVAPDILVSAQDRALLSFISIQ